MRASFILAAAAAALAGPALAESSGGEAVAEVVVTGTGYAVSLDSATTSVSVLTREDLDLAPPVGLGDLLSGAPGVRSSFHGPGASRPIIRGLAGPRVLVLENGVGLVDASTLSPDHAVASEPGEAHRIEVLRGPSALAYGGSAIGGVVNILDDRIPRAAPESGMSGRVSASAGSADDSHAVSVGITGGGGPLAAGVDLVRRESRDYRVPANPVTDQYAAAAGATALGERRQRNTAVRLDAYGAGVSLVGAQGYVGVSMKRTETRYGTPYPQLAGPPPEEGPVLIDLKQSRFDLRGERALEAGPFDQLRVSAGYADYEHAEIAVVDGEVGTRFLSRGGEARLELVQRDRGGWQGAAGLQVLTRDFEAQGEEAFVPPVGIDELGVFVLQRLDRGDWGVEGGVRLDRRRLDASLDGRPTSAAALGLGRDWTGARARRAFTNPSASAAAFWRPASGWFVSLALAHNRRAPTEFELFSDGPHAGTAAYEVGDPGLKSERVTSLEATLRWTGTRGRVEAHAYVARYRGFIAETATGVRVGEGGVPDPDGALPLFRFAASDPTFRGGEIEAAYEIWRDGDRRLSLEGAFDHVRARTEAGPPPRIPPFGLTGRVVWSSPRLAARVELRRVGRQGRVAPFESPTGGYSMVNARAAWRPLADSDFKIFVDGRNLLDAEAREHASFLKDIAPLPGRALRAGVALTF